MNTFSVLVTTRLTLREFCLDDTPSVFDILCREAVNQWLETDALKSVQGAEERIQSRINLFHDKMGFHWAVTLRENPAKVMGSCGYFSVRRDTQTVETGYELHPDYWRQGIMSEAPQVMIVFSFGTQNLIPVHRIEALVAPGNIASIRILEKFGFFKEGLRCEFGFWKGHYQDVFLYALLNKKK